MAEQGFEVTGLDRVREFTELARKLVPTAHILDMDFSDIDSLDTDFDIVVDVCSLYQNEENLRLY